MTFDPSFHSAPPTADPTEQASWAGSLPATSTDELANAVASARLGGVLAGRSDLETWTPETTELAAAAIADVARYCQTYCPAVHACGEERCRLWRLEERAARILQPGPADAVGVVDDPIVGL